MIAVLVLVCVVAAFVCWAAVAVGAQSEEEND